MAKRDYSIIEKLPFKEKHGIDYILEALEEKDAKIVELNNKITSVLEVKKAEPFKKYLFQSLEIEKRLWKPTNYYSSNKIPGITIKEIENFIEQEKPIREENLKIIEQNKTNLTSSLEFFERLGIKKTKKIRKNNRSLNYIEVTQEWVNEITQSFPTYDSYSMVLSGYDRMIKALETYFKQIENDKLEKEKVEQKKVGEQNKLKLFVLLAQKYGLNSTEVITYEDLLEKILEKDQHLMLAHYLLKNRNDWNDGPSYAEQGLSNYTLDDGFYEQIQELIADWDNDGRIFRHIYENLFSLVDDDLNKDYELLSNYSSY